MRLLFYFDLEPVALQEYIDISASGKLESDDLHHMVTELDRKASPSLWALGVPVGVWELKPRPRVLQVSPARFRSMFEAADRLTVSMVREDWVEVGFTLKQLVRPQYAGFVMGATACDMMSDIMYAVEERFFERLVETGENGSKIKAWRDLWSTLAFEFEKVAADKSYVRFVGGNADEASDNYDDY